MSLLPLSAALGDVILETRFLEQRWPHEAERSVIQRALFDLHIGVSTALVAVDKVELDEAAASKLREAFMVTLVLAVSLQRMIARARRPIQAARRTLAADAMRALGRLLDALDPFLARVDVALRRVMLEGVSSEQAAQQIALPV